MSNGNPVLEERLGDVGRATMASKKTDTQKIHDTDAPALGRPVHNVEKYDNSHQKVLESFLKL